MLLEDIGSVHYSIIGTTLSMLNSIQQLYFPSSIETTISGKAGDLQFNLWMTGQNISNLTSFDSFYFDPGTGSSIDQNSYSMPLEEL